LNVIVNSEISEDHLDGSIDIKKWRDLAFRTLQAEGVQIGELNLIFVDSQVIEQLNETYLGKSEPTDVLAFPIDPFQISETDTPLLLGDVIICPEKAKENAKAQNKTFEEEIALLVLHGVLHILGYDHAEPEEKAVMRRREKQLLSELYSL
tara:strand:+ start:10099 stop:10551 length:453 start_codon:yes stop_codon:yes gene_type:complete